MSKTSFGAVIAHIRSKLGIAQGDLASTLGITQSYFSQIETGHKQASSSLLNKIASELKVPLGFMYLLSITKEDVPAENINVWEMLNPVIKKLAISIFPETLEGL